MGERAKSASTLTSTRSSVKSTRDRSRTRNRAGHRKPASATSSDGVTKGATVAASNCKWCGRGMAGRSGPCPQRRRFAPCERAFKRVSARRQLNAAERAAVNARREAAGDG